MSTVHYTDEAIASMKKKDLSRVLSDMGVDYAKRATADQLRGILSRAQASTPKAEPEPAPEPEPAADGAAADLDDLDAILAEANKKAKVKKAAKKAVDRVGRSGSRGWALMMKRCLETDGPVSIDDLYAAEEADLYCFGRGGNDRTKTTVEVRAREFKKYGACFGCDVLVTKTTVAIDRKNSDKNVLKAMAKRVESVLESTTPPADFNPPALQGSDVLRANKAEKANEAAA